ICPTPRRGAPEMWRHKPQEIFEFKEGDMSQLLSRTILTVGAFGITFVTSATAVAQSREMDRPTELKSREQSVMFDSRVQHYYTFTAGPGDVRLFIAGQAFNGGAVAVSAQLYDDRLEKIGNYKMITPWPDGQDMLTNTLARRQKVVLQIIAQPTTARSGSY